MPAVNARKIALSIPWKVQKRLAGWNMLAWQDSVCLEAGIDDSLDSLEARWAHLQYGDFRQPAAGAVGEKLVEHPIPGVGVCSNHIPGILQRRQKILAQGNDAKTYAQVYGNGQRHCRDCLTQEYPGCSPTSGRKARTSRKPVLRIEIPEGAQQGIYRLIPPASGQCQQGENNQYSASQPC